MNVILISFQLSGLELNNVSVAKNAVRDISEGYIEQDQKQTQPIAENFGMAPHHLG
jgi:hypothetical protein